MDEADFDRWTRRLQARRTLWVTLASLTVGRGVAHPTIAGPRSAPSDRKRGRGRRLGCTQQADSCASVVAIPCPKAASGASFCVTNNKGKPICVIFPSKCAPCASKADCEPTFGTRAICVKECLFCQGVGLQTACVVPA